MTEPTPQLPPALRDALRRDAAPVRPLLAPRFRALALALPATIAMAAAAFLYPGVDLAMPLFSFAGGGVSLLQGAAALLLLWLALREGVPGFGLGGARAALAVGGGLTLALALGLALWWRGGATLVAPGAAEAGRHCASAEGAMAIPYLAAAFWLLSGALPVRPRSAGALAGAASALLADAVWHLACARVDLEHLLVWHLGAALVLTLAGALSASVRWRRAIESSRTSPS